jgi:hypothetical protein
MDKKRKLIIIGVAATFALCICSIILFLLFIKGRDTAGLASPGTNPANATSASNSACPRDYETDPTKWVQIDSLARLSLKLPASFTAKAVNETNYEFRGNAKRGCEHTLHISMGDYPVAPKCQDALKSYQDQPNLSGQVTMLPVVNIGGLEACALDYQITEGNTINYRRFYSIYKGTTYYVIQVWTYNKDDFTTYDQILSTLRLK